MKKLILLFAFSCALLGQEPTILKSSVLTSQGVVTKEYFPQIILKPRVPKGTSFATMKKGIGVSEAAALALAITRSAISVADCDQIGYCYVLLQSGTDLRTANEMVEMFNQDFPHFESAQLAPVLRTRQATGVSSIQYPYAQAQWYLGNTFPGSIGWSSRTGEVNGNIYYIPFDSGLIYNHPSLDQTKLVKELVWSGVPSKFVPEEGADDNGHGNAKASIVLSTKNMVGLANWVHYGNFRVIDNNGVANPKVVVDGLMELVNNRLKLLPPGSRVLVSMSFGSLDKIQAIDDAIKLVLKAGVGVDVAAGNNGVNADLFPQTPTTTPGVLSVGACDADNQMVTNIRWASTYGRKTVALCAPGTDILVAAARSTEGVTGPIPFDPAFVDRLNGGYVRTEGTSFSVAFVDAAVLNLWADDPSLSFEQIKMRLLNANRDLKPVTIWDRQYAGRDLFQSAGRLDWAKTLAPKPNSLPAKPQISVVAGHSAIKVKLEGDSQPSAVHCDVDGQPWEAVPYLGDDIIVTGLDGAPLDLVGVDHHISCKVADFAGRWSADSSLVTFTIRKAEEREIALTAPDLGPGPLTQTIIRLDGFVPQVLWNMNSRVTGVPVLYAGRPESLDYRVGDNDSVADIRADLPQGFVSLHLSQFVQMVARQSWGHYDKAQISVIWEDGEKREGFLVDLLPNNTTIMPEQYALDLSQFAGKSVIIRLRFFTNGSSVGAGWVIYKITLKTS